MRDGCKSLGARRQSGELNKDPPGLEKTLESPLDSKEIKLGNPKGKSTLNTHCKN